MSLAEDLVASTADCVATALEDNPDYQKFLNADSFSTAIALLTQLKEEGFSHIPAQKGPEIVTRPIETLILQLTIISDYFSQINLRLIDKYNLTFDQIIRSIENDQRKNNPTFHFSGLVIQIAENYWLAKIQTASIATQYSSQSPS